MTEQVFVAREQELARLQTFLDRALAGLSAGPAQAGHGQVCFVTGEAGAGKTALVTEFTRRAQAQHNDLLVAIGNYNAHTGAGDPYLPFREVLRLLTADVEGRPVTPENARRLQGFLQVSGQALVDLGVLLKNVIDCFLELLVGTREQLLDTDEYQVFWRHAKPGRFSFKL